MIPRKTPNVANGATSLISCSPASQCQSDLETFGGFHIYATRMEEVGKFKIIGLRA
jgi:hypothetical protein